MIGFQIVLLLLFSRTTAVAISKLPSNEVNRLLQSLFQ